MPGLPQRNDDDNNDNNNQFRNNAATSLSCSNGSVSANGFWSKHRGDVSYNLLQKVLLDWIDVYMFDFISKLFLFRIELQCI